MSVNTAHVTELILEKQENKISTLWRLLVPRMGEWKWLFVRCCECKSRISKATDCLILFQEGTSATSMFDTNDPSVLKLYYIY